MEDFKFNEDYINELCEKTKVSHQELYNWFRRGVKTKSVYICHYEGLGPEDVQIHISYLVNKQDKIIRMKECLVSISEQMYCFGFMGFYYRRTPTRKRKILAQYRKQFL